MAAELLAFVAVVACQGGALPRPGFLAAFPNISVRCFRIDIDGNTQVADEVIKDCLELKPGWVITPARWARSQERLLRLYRRPGVQRSKKVPILLPTCVRIDVNAIWIGVCAYVPH